MDRKRRLLQPRSAIATIIRSSASLESRRDCSYWLHLPSRCHVQQLHGVGSQKSFRGEKQKSCIGAWSSGSPRPHKWVATHVCHDPSRLQQVSSARHFEDLYHLGVIFLLKHASGGSLYEAPRHHSHGNSILHFNHTVANEFHIIVSIIINIHKLM